MMGCLPLIFDKLKLNKKPQVLMRSKSLLFTSSMLSYSPRNTNLTDNEIKAQNKMKLLKNSILVGGVDAKTTEDRLEFLLKNPTILDPNNPNILSKETPTDNIFNEEKH
jgi:hypothetical protein